MSERLLRLGVVPAKPNVLTRLIHKLRNFFSKEKSRYCICGRRKKDEWNVNIDIFIRHVYDKYQGRGTEWVATSICINCYRKNKELLTQLEKKGLIRIGKDAWRRAGDKWEFKPLDSLT